MSNHSWEGSGVLEGDTFNKNPKMCDRTRNYDCLAVTLHKLVTKSLVGLVYDFV